MIKLILNLAQLLVVIVITLLFSSCGFDKKTLDGSGNVVTQNRTVATGFTTITTSGNVEVYITQGSASTVVVEADDNLQQHIKTEVKGTELSITCDVNIDNAEAKRVTVTLPKIEGIEAAGGSIVKGKTQLKGDKIMLSSSSGSNLEVSVDAKEIASEASSGSSLKISGRTNDLKTDASSGSSLNASALIAKDVKADASSGGNIAVNPTESLDADASSGSVINYVSTPKKINSDASSGGSISQE